MRICLSLFYALWTLFLHILQVLFKGARNEHSKNCVEINVFLYILEKNLSCCSGRRESHGEQGAPSEGFSEMALRQFSTV